MFNLLSSTATLSRQFVGTTRALSIVGVRSFSSASLVGPPVASVVPPGVCVFSQDWTAAPLLSKKIVSHDTRLFTFGLADKSKSLGLSTCACILARGSADAEGKPIVRPYTPISTNATVGEFNIMAKVYPAGHLSKHMDGLEVGETVEFAHIPFNVKLQYPFNKKKIGMLVGGTGIAPMIQALHAILGTPGDDTRVSMLYGSRTVEDILGRDLLQAWSASFPERLCVIDVLSHEPETSDWTGSRGMIGRDLIQAHMPAPSEDCILFVCGPPVMYDVLCGPRSTTEISGLLAEMGYSQEQVYKF